MDKEERKRYEADIERSVMASIKDAKYPIWRRSQWDEWGSPVGLSLGWALFIVPLGVFLWLLHIAGLLR